MARAKSEGVLPTHLEATRPQTADFPAMRTANQLLDGSEVPVCEARRWGSALWVLRLQAQPTPPQRPGTGIRDNRTITLSSLVSFLLAFFPREELSYNPIAFFLSYNCVKK